MKWLDRFLRRDPYALRIIGEVRSMALKEDSVIVITYTCRLSMEQIAQVTKSAEAFFGDRKVVVLESGASIMGMDKGSTC